MRRLAMGAIALTMVLGLASGAAAQGCGQGDIPLGDIYLSFQSDIYDRYIGTAEAVGGDPEDTQIPAFNPFMFYLVTNIDYCECGDCSLNFNKGFTAWEAQLDLSAAPGLTIISAQLNPAGSSNFANPATSNFLVGTGGNCVTGDQQPYAVVTFTGLLQAVATDLRIDVIPASPPTPRGSPGWNQCPVPDGILYPFISVNDAAKDTRGYENGYIVINPVETVGTEETTWGGFKAGFDGE